MKYLITSGCSFTSSARVNYHRSDDTFLRDDKQMWYYPHWLQRTLPDIKIYNMGSPGNNNSMIVRSALYKAKELIKNGVDPKEISMIIQWSSYFRRTHFISNELTPYIEFEKHSDFVNDYLKEKEYAGQNGYWLNLAIPDMKYSSIERESPRVFQYNQSYLETLYNDESRYIEWLEYFDYLIQFCKANGIELKCFFMHNSFSLKYDYGLMPGGYPTKQKMIKGIFEDKDIINTWNDKKLRIDDYPYAKYLYDSIDWDKYCWFFEEEGLHKYGGVFEWTIRNQIKSTDIDFNPLWMEYQHYRTQTKLENALLTGEIGHTGHVSSCNYKKFTDEVILKWDMFKDLTLQEN